MKLKHTPRQGGRPHGGRAGFDHRLGNPYPALVTLNLLYGKVDRGLRSKLLYHPPLTTRELNPNQEWFMVLQHWAWILAAFPRSQISPFFPSRRPATLANLPDQPNSWVDKSQGNNNVMLSRWWGARNWWVETPRKLLRVLELKAVMELSVCMRSVRARKKGQGCVGGCRSGEAPTLHGHGN